MCSKLSSNDIKNYINEIEKKWKVETWSVNDIYIWPYIRIKLYIFLLNYTTRDTSESSGQNISIKKNISLEKKFKLIGRFRNAIILLNYFFWKLEPKKILFFGSHFHRTLQKEVYFNRFFDPMVDTHLLQDEVYMIEFEKVHEKNYNQKAIIPLHKYLDHYKLLKKLEGLFVPMEKVTLELNAYDTFYDKLISEFPEARNLNISIEQLKCWAQKINRTKGFFSKLYKKIKPEKIMFLSYYGYDDLAAALLAAHELGIKTIDFQHGPQTNVHMAYSCWTKHPDRPYNTMPLEYWTWDQRSKDNIEEWAGKTGSIKVKKVGHPYLAYLKKRVLLRQGDEKIFFSLQTLSLKEMFPVVLFELMRESELKWILRMHPRSNFTKEELMSFLNKNKIDQSIYEIQDALNTPLPEALAVAKLHLTNFSGCVLEAGMVNIPSLIIHEAGKDIFKAYIDEKSVYYLNPDEIGFKEAFINILEKQPEKNIEREIREIPNPLE